MDTNRPTQEKDMEDEGRKMNKGGPKFQANEGRFKHNPEAQRAASKKGNEKQREIAAKRKLVKDKQVFLNEAIQAIVDKDPKVLEKILQNVADIAKGDDKAAISAASIFMEYSGMKAPKQQEVKVEEKREDISEVEKQLENLGVKLVIDNDNVKGEG